MEMATNTTEEIQITTDDTTPLQTVKQFNTHGAYKYLGITTSPNKNKKRYNKNNSFHLRHIYTQNEKSNHNT